MGRHASPAVSDKPQDMLIWDHMTNRVRKEMEEHPRRYADVTVGMNIRVHDGELNREFVGIVIALNPLQVTWRY